MEVNFNYTDPNKILNDLTKLIDPVNSFREMVYFAYG